MLACLRYITASRATRSVCDRQPCCSGHMAILSFLPCAAPQKGLTTISRQQRLCGGICRSASPLLHSMVCRASNASPAVSRRSLEQRSVGLWADVSLASICTFAGLVKHTFGYRVSVTHIGARLSTPPRERMIQ